MADRAPPSQTPAGVAGLRSRAGPVVLLGGWTVLATLMGLVGPVVARDRPLLLMVLSPRLPVILAVSREAWPAFLAVGLIRLSISDPVNFMVGRRHGRQLLTSHTARRFKLEGILDRVPKRAWPLLVALGPSGSTMLAAGSSDASAVAAGVANVAATMVLLVSARLTGPAVAATAQTMVPLSWALLVATTTVGLARWAWRRRFPHGAGSAGRRQRPRHQVGSVEQEETA